MELMNELKISSFEDGSFEMERINLPKTPTVYFIYNSKKELIYIGQTKDLHRRTVSHFFQDRWFKLFARYLSYVDTSVEELRSKEYSLIQEFRPKFNVEHYTGVTEEYMRELAKSKPTL